MEGTLSRHFAESVSAGRHHAAALAGPMNVATGKAYEGLESTVVFMWGRGQEGQLGHGSYASSSSPQLVEDLRDRRISQAGPLMSHSMGCCETVFKAMLGILLLAVSYFSMHHKNYQDHLQARFFQLQGSQPLSPSQQLLGDTGNRRRVWCRLCSLNALRIDACRLHTPCKRGFHNSQFLIPWLQVACGGYQTMAVCAHDPKADDTEERRKGYKAKMKQWFTGSRLNLEMGSKEGNSGPPSASSAGPNRMSSQRDPALPKPG